MFKAVFLDRDGVINIDHGYVFQIENFQFKHGIFELCSEYQKKGFKIFVVTNQAGIAKGLYQIDDFERLNRFMIEKFLLNGIIIEKTFYCPHHPDYSAHCFCRKPLPGMILRARDEFNLNLEESILFGDKDSDILAAKAPGLKCSFLVDSMNPDLQVVNEFTFK